ncbi:glycosyltransferase family 4 protein [Megalodesulfovibrio gigas]|uniref:Putative glycosyl transferase group 1 n=1 Tax=Megalodesulfovibrio gigas (strain ATCC 19364 / DSM 1382 / NCIMB 9332 / VKM B-1759) TaxID=1121448 RepID=T2GCY2_MEGG1|nr:glycosyltransferase family 4 protein [Megalodesulfovibrio gigas]AGW13986.1 putative glycosyl transferase group 1 [Megalodesulfovibrio gigas DSM 1382 = ATCC 19364]
MRLAFVTPMRPLAHPRLSGDVTIAQDLADFFAQRGHTVIPAGQISTDRIWERPWRWPALAREALRLVRLRPRVDAVFTYHAYYRAPDLLGALAARCGAPYIVFAPAYATNRRRHWRSRPGYELNRYGLRQADLLVSNKQPEVRNLLRIVPEEKLLYVPPGIRTECFSFDAQARAGLRAAWNTGDDPVLAVAAMLREDVKAEGLEWVIRTAGRLLREGTPLRLAVAGDGPARARLEALAAAELPGRAVFVGRMDRFRLQEFYSAGDLFVFPGIREGLGMVYLEAQCCGLPCVAWDHDGAPEVVRHGVSGFVTPSYDAEAFAEAIRSLLTDPARRVALGRSAREYVLANHDVTRNYGRMETRILELLAARRQEARS